MSFTQESKTIFKGLDRIIWVVIGTLGLVYAASGAFQVQANEKAVVFRFGKAGDVVDPGIGYHWPWPVERVVKVNVEEVQRVEVGFWPGVDFSEELLPYCITGDKNIIHNNYVIQYRIAEPTNFLTRCVRAREILVELAQATILEVVAQKQVDPILTTGKGEMERAIFEGLTKKLTDLNLRLQIVGVERQKAEPPNLVRDAFQDVVNAREEKRAAIHEAENYKNQEIPKAKGQAARERQQARAYKVERIAWAKGESERFLKLYEEYKRAPAVTRSRLFIEMVEQVLPRVRVMVLASDKQGKPLKIKLLQAPVPTSPRLPD